MTMSLRDEVETNGFAIVPDVLDQREIHDLLISLSDPEIASSRRGAEVYGARNLLRVRSILDLANSRAIRDLVEPIVGARALVVRGLFFDKTEGANWPVPWHQDLSVAVAGRVEVDGWCNWTLKAGVHHVQPPHGILERMIAVRIHFDDCNFDSGPLRVVPGSHRFGRVARSEVIELTRENREHVCIAKAGSALVMKPLLLHASSPALRPAHRRVVHLEFAGEDLLPQPLRWAS